MPKYITLYRFTQQGARNVKESPDRVAAAVEKGREMGMKVLSTHYTEGPWDLVVVSEAEDEKKATAFALTILGQGNVESTTMRAWDPDEFREIVSLMP